MRAAGLSAILRSLVTQRSRQLATTLALWLIASVATAFAVEGPPDWPMYRGAPSLAGVAAGNLPEKPVLLWTFKTGGPVKSSAAIVGNNIYVGSDDAKLYALNRAGGRKLWEFAAGGRIDSSPTWHNGTVLFGSADGWA